MNALMDNLKTKMDNAGIALMVVLAAKTNILVINVIQV